MTKKSDKPMKKKPATIPSPDARTKIVPIRVTDAEHAELLAASEAEVMELSTWLRRLGLIAARAKRNAPPSAA